MTPQPRGVAKPRIHVVVPTMGTRPNWLRQSLLSIVKQKAVIQQIVVVLPSGGDASPTEGLPYVRVEREDRTGLSVAINSGMESANAEYVTWLGDDDLLAPDSLRRSVEAMQHHPSAPFSYGRTRYIDSDGATIGLTRPSTFAAWHLKYGKDFIPQPGSLVRHAAWLSVGGVDDSLENAMDLKLFLDLCRLGKPVHIKAELSAYRIHSDSITLTKGMADEGETIRRGYQSRNAARTYAIWRPMLRLSDKWVDRAFRLAPCDPPELVDDIPYTGARL